MLVHVGQAVETDTALPVTVVKRIGIFRHSESRKEAVKDRRIANLEKQNYQLDLEVESLLAEKQRKLSPVTPPENTAWYLD